MVLKLECTLESPGPFVVNPFVINTGPRWELNLRDLDSGNWEWMPEVHVYICLVCNSDFVSNHLRQINML